MKKRAIILYAEFNLDMTERAGGVAHLRATVEGLKENGYSCIVMCRFGWPLVRKEGKATYCNILALPSLHSDDQRFGNISFQSSNYPRFLKRVAKNIVTSINFMFIDFIDLVVRPSLIIERAIKNRAFIVRKSRRNCSRVYEVNDFRYDKDALSSADKVLITNKNNYPPAGNYFERPWPVMISSPIATNSKKVDCFSIAYLGSLGKWHNLPGMTKLIDDLHANDSRWKMTVYGPEEPFYSSALSERQHIVYGGFLGPEQIEPCLGAHGWGLMIFTQDTSTERLGVGSPSKLIHYVVAGMQIIATKCGEEKLLDSIQDRMVFYRPEDHLECLATIQSRALDSSKWTNIADQPLLAIYRP